MTTLYISSHFDSGAIEVVTLANPRDIQLRIRPDNASEFAQWFHFCLHGAKGVPVTLRFLNAGACAFPKGWDGYRVVASTDRQHWFRVDAQFDGQQMVVNVTPQSDALYLAYFEPYSYERHLDLIASTGAHEGVAVQRLGSTLDGRDMTLLCLTDPQSATPEAHKKKVWLIARQHPGESMAEWFAEGFLARLTDRADPVARVLLARCVFYVVPNMNPDGAVRGNLRTNAAGANLNREWAAPTLETSPEVFLVRQAMQQTGVDLFLDAHGDEGLPYNFVAGTEGNPGYTPRLQALANTFKASWQSTCPDFQTKHGYGTTPAGTANQALATHWVGQNFDCLAFTIEMPFKDNADLPDARVGWNGERSKKLGASVLLAVLAVVGQLR